MTEMIRNYQEKIKIGPEQSYKNLTMFPLLSGFSSRGNYLSMNESLSNNIIDNNWIDKNRSTTKHMPISKPIELVPLLDGQSSAGVNQNWRDSDTAVTYEKKTDLMVDKRAAQNRTLYDSNRNSGSEGCASSWDYLEQFARVDSQIGAIFLINGKIAGLICFDSPAAFEKSFMNIVECYAKKAVDEFSLKIMPKSLKPEVINYLRAPNNAWIETRSI